MQYTAVANTWVSPFVYYTLMNKLSVWAPDPPVVLLSGVVDKEARQRGTPVRPTGSTANRTSTSARPVTWGSSSGAWATSSLASAGFDPSFRYPPGPAFPDRASPAPRPSRCACPGSMALRRSSSFVAAPVVATRLVSPNAPTVSVTSPAAGAAFSVGETVTVSWRRRRTPTAVGLSYTPMLSTDDGVTVGAACRRHRRDDLRVRPHAARRSPSRPRSRCSSPTA